MLNLLDLSDSLNPITNTSLNILIQNTYTTSIHSLKLSSLTGSLSAPCLLDNLSVHVNSVTSTYLNLKSNNNMLAIHLLIVAFGYMSGLLTMPLMYTVSISTTKFFTLIMYNYTALNALNNLNSFTFS